MTEVVSMTVALAGPVKELFTAASVGSDRKADRTMTLTFTGHVTGDPAGVDPSTPAEDISITYTRELSQWSDESGTPDVLQGFNAAHSYRITIEDVTE